jgi:hypothetical protein
MGYKFSIAQLQDYYHSTWSHRYSDLRAEAERKHRYVKRSHNLRMKKNLRDRDRPRECVRKQSTKKSTTSNVVTDNHDQIDLNGHNNDPSDDARSLESVNDDDADDENDDVGVQLLCTEIGSAEDVRDTLQMEIDDDPEAVEDVKVDGDGIDVDHMNEKEREQLGLQIADADIIEEDEEVKEENLDQEDRAGGDLTSDSVRGSYESLSKNSDRIIDVHTDSDTDFVSKPDVVCEGINCDVVEFYDLNSDDSSVSTAIVISQDLSWQL